MSNKDMVFDNEIRAYTCKLKSGATLALKNTGITRWFKIEVVEVDEVIK